MTTPVEAAAGAELAARRSRNRRALELGQQARLVRGYLGVADAPPGACQLRRGPHRLHVSAQRTRGCSSLDLERPVGVDEAMTTCPPRSCTLSDREHCIHRVPPGTQLVLSFCLCLVTILDCRHHRRLPSTLYELLAVRARPWCERQEPDVSLLITGKLHQFFGVSEDDIHLQAL